MSDYTVADTIYALFTTRSFSTGAPTQLAGTPVVSAYENESLTQITAGVTLGVDHDTVTGLNLVTVVASGANGFEAGKDYHLVITTGTVGGVSVVGEVVFRFTLSRSAAAVDLANGTDGLGAIKADTAAILVDTAVIGSTGQGLTSLATQASVDTIDNFLDTEITAILAAVDTEVAAILSDTNAILVDTGTTLQAELDAIQAAVITNAAGVDIAADIIALKAVADAVLVDTGTTLDAALAVVDANVDSILADTGTDGVVVNAAGLAADAVTEIRSLVSGTADSGTTTTMVDAARTEADTDYWKDMAILFTSGTISGQARLITAFDAATDTITFSPAVTQAVGTNTYEILPNVAAAGSSAPTAAEVADAVWDEAQAGHVTAGSFGEIATETAAILVDTAEIGAAGAGLTALATQASVNTIDDFLDTEVAAILAAVDTEVAAVKAKTDSLTFTVAGVVDANVQRVNDVAITGDGAVTPFNV